MNSDRQRGVKFLAGGVFAMNRFRKYENYVVWNIHSEYKGFEILRAYHEYPRKPCSLYGFWVEMGEGIFVVSENLDGIKKEATKIKEGKA